MEGDEIEAKLELEVIKPEQIPHLFEPGEVGCVLEVVVTDKEGKVTDHRIQKSQSFVRAFLELLWLQMQPVEFVDPYLIADVGNMGRSLFENIRTFGCAVGIGDTSRGIRVGTGTTAPNINDYNLETPIGHGTGVGQLQYSAMTFGAPASDTTTSQFTITRNFANASGGSITVNEIGLCVGSARESNLYSFLTIRDVIAGGIAVPNGQTLTVNYRPQCTV